MTSSNGKALYYTNCVSLPDNQVETLCQMVSDSVDITWKTFLKYVDLDEIKETFPFYSYNRETHNPTTGELTCGFHIKKDYSVSFSKSHWGKIPCWFITHSAIEYVFLDLKEVDNA